MTIKEAIEKLNKERDIKCQDCNVKHYDLAIEALKKQIPTRPIIKSWCPAYCPSCHAELSENKGDGYYKHYTNLKVCDCGQKLKWD